MLQSNNAHVNTTDETGSALSFVENKAQSQQTKVLDVFSTYHDMRWAPSAVHQKLISDGVIPDMVPLTSIRRAISKLESTGYLRKTQFKQVGPFGRRENTWEMAL